MSDEQREFFRKMSHENLVELLVAKYGEVEKLKGELSTCINVCFGQEQIIKKARSECAFMGIELMVPSLQKESK